MSEHEQQMMGAFAPVVLDQAQIRRRQAEGAHRVLTDEFIVPPFSVLDARQGYWQERKRAWLALGLRGEVGRGDVLPSGAGSVYSGSSAWSGHRGTPRGRQAGRCFGQDLMRGEHAVGQPRMAFNSPSGEYEYPTDMLAKHSGTSIFDPVLCEVVYRWFCPPGARILDPFAGGPTRGVVAAALGYAYTGVDVRPEQVAANAANWLDVGPLLPMAAVPPSWLVGDSTQLDALLPPGARYDLLFTCPPYYNLEVYSHGDGDLSAKQSYDEFMVWYYDLFEVACQRLRENRFALVVVGEIRDQKGAYRNFVGDSVSVFRTLGLHYYNEAILVTSAGSLPLRIGKQFGKWRKLGKSHQNVLAFYKGDLGAIAEHYPLLGGGEGARLAGAKNHLGGG